MHRLAYGGLLLGLLMLAACGQTEEEPRYYEIRVEGRQQEELEKNQFLLGRQYYQGEPVSILAEPSGAEGAGGSMDVYLCPMGGDKRLLLEAVSNEYRVRGWYLDDKGRYFIVSQTGVTRLGADGKLLYHSGMEDTVRDICSLEDGRVILLTDKEGLWKFWELDPDTGKAACAQKPSEQGGSAYIGVSGGGLALLNEQGFWRLDLKKGTKELELPFRGSFYTVDRIGESPADFWLDGSEAGILWSTGREEQLERVDITDEKEVILVRGKGSDWLKKQIELFNRSNESYFAVLEEPELETSDDDFHTETNLKLASGKGADIIFSNAVDKDVSALIEKGVFADLAPLMEASGIREEDYFRTAFDAWREGERIYGIAPSLFLWDYVLDREVLGSRELTIETLVDSMLEFEGDRVFRSGADGVWILDYFLEGSEDLWGMVDWEKGTCDFRGELFSKMLRAAKRYAADGKHQYPAIVSNRFCNSLYSIDTPKALEAKNQIQMGVFFDDGHYAHTNLNIGTAMGINAESEHVEGAWELLVFLLGEDAQSVVGYGDGVFPVNRNAFEQLIERELEASNATEKIEVDGVVYEVPSNQRFGQKFTEEQAEEARRMYAGAKTLPYKIRPLLAIIEEEAAYYFDGVKDMEEVIGLTENRVQLYLDELGKR